MEKTHIKKFLKPLVLTTAFFVVFVLNVPWVWAEPAVPLYALENMPVKEITVFKDGHALVLHNGKMPTDESGNVVMDYLPLVQQINCGAAEQQQRQDDPGFD